MFQLRQLNRSLAPGLLAAARADAAPLPERADRLIADLRHARTREAGRRGGVTGLAARVDAWLRTDEPEFLDRDDIAPARKVAIVAGLDRLNRRLLAYRRFLAVLRPGIQRLHREEGRLVRVLELASGSGDFALELARQAQRHRLPLEVCGSDYLDAHVEEGRRKAAARGLEVEFRNLNAFNLDDLLDDEFDFIFLTQTLHHFTPGQLARVVEQASRKAAHGFIGIDVQRSPHVWGIVPAMAVLNPDYGFLHDGIVSIRKMYSEPELEMIARLAAPQAQVRTYGMVPGYSVLEVRAH